MQLNYEPSLFLGSARNMWGASFPLYLHEKLQKVGGRCFLGTDLDRDASVKTDLVAMVYRNGEDDDCCDFAAVKLLELGVNEALVASAEPVGVVGDEVDVSVLLPFGRDGFSLNLKAVVGNMRYMAIRGGSFQVLYSLKFKHMSNEDLLLIESYMRGNLRPSIKL